ncbi:SRPBCC domain-containing protein [Flavihumibacter sp. CACIAM 22H1]|uniref:SRPBCC domain-containing protein n=1 Tax=Flavihumibacter sp. CACIAM 22H1 TaxID=1812911 RepID=UPI0007A85CBD|nr:SRPBCC domain-containing protein [Flavihumibacter sp. CACIAM 22H1]KYP13637.1 MAG: ATPase [Flavihumibacter sp. CACIAM 22H1]
MDYKTKIQAAPGKQELFIIREFDLPVDLVFKAYQEPELLEQWMNTRVIKLENRTHGSYQFETTDPTGKVHIFSGTIHEFEPGKKITRTFKMENTSFDVQLEFLEFEALSAERSKLIMQVVYRSVAMRDQLLEMPFEWGINRAHDQLEAIFAP